MAGHGKKGRESAFTPRPPSCTECFHSAQAQKSWYDEFTSDSVTASEHVEKEWEGSLRNVSSDSVHFRGAENGVLADPSTIQADETPFAEMFKEFNLSDYKAFHTMECLASFAWGQMLNPSASGEQVARYLKSSCSCLTKQSPHTTYEEQAAEALQALRAGNPTKAQMLFSATVERKHREGKAALVRLHDPAAAVSLYRKATELDPENIHGWVMLETLLLQTGNPAQTTEARRHRNQAAKKIIEDWAWLQIRRKRV